MSNRDLQESAYGSSIGDVIDEVTWLWRHTRDVTIFKVVAFRNYDPGQLSVWTLQAHTLL